MTNPSDEAEAHPGTPRESEAEETDGQVSEVSGLDDAGAPISDGDYTVGDEESETDNAGPDAIPEANQRDSEV